MKRRKRTKRPIQQLMLTDQQDWMKLRAEVESLSCLALDLARTVSDLRHEVLALRTENERRSTRARQANRTRREPVSAEPVSAEPVSAEPVSAELPAVHQVEPSPEQQRSEQPCATSGAAASSPSKDAGSSGKGSPPLSPSTNGRFTGRKKNASGAGAGDGPTGAYGQPRVTEGEVQAALDFGKTADQHLPQ